MVRGTVAASFTIEDFSIGRVRDLRMEEIEARIETYVTMLSVR